MSRIVLTGTPGALYRPTLADLPPDNDLSNSYFRYVDASGFNLSAYNMTDVDIFDSDCRNVTLPTSIDYLMSRRTNWAGAAIPAMVSSYNHDLVVELLKQEYLTATAAVKPRLQMVYDWVAADYTHSWQDAIWQLINVGGYSVTQIRNAFNAAFGGRPRLLERLAKHLDGGIWRQDSPNTVMNMAAVPVILSSPPATVNVTIPAGALDRWATARALELANPGLRFYIGQLDPHPIVFMVGGNVASHYEWWKDVWPV